MLSPWMVFNHSIYIYIYLIHISHPHEHTPVWGPAKHQPVDKHFNAVIQESWDILGHLGCGCRRRRRRRSSASFSSSPFTLHFYSDRGPWTMDGGWWRRRHRPSSSSSSSIIISPWRTKTLSLSLSLPWPLAPSFLEQANE